ncbi:MAG: integrase [Gemmataceae bacterium]|nr:integrase [Gemmataceae bacterium]
MASISTAKNGNRKIQFVNGNGERKSIYLGKMKMKTARDLKTRVEALNSAKGSRSSLDNETAEWVANIEDDLAGKLAAVGLIAKRVKTESSTMGGLVEHVVGLRADAKPRTLTNLKQAGAKLNLYFGRDRALKQITAGDADKFVAAMRAHYSAAYVSRLIKYGKQFFHAARRAGFVTSNPFDGVKAGSMANPERMYYLTEADTRKIIDACPDAEWRLIVALARFGGLRCPSELAALTWADVDWERGRFLVKSPKTAHHADGGRRWVPIFLELRPHLEAAFDNAEPGTVFVVKRTCCHDTNLRTTFERIVYRAGLIPWPKPFQNMRASRETELAQTHPLHVVTAWIGNSARIAAKHYLQVTDSDFAKAVEGKESLEAIQPKQSEGDARTTQNPTQSLGEIGSLEGTLVPSCEQKRLEKVETPRNAGEMKLDRYARQESNNPAVSAEIPHTSSVADVKSDALSENSTSSAVSLLAKLAAGLTPSERAALARMLAGGSEGG